MFSIAAAPCKTALPRIGGLQDYEKQNPGHRWPGMLPFRGGTRRTLRVGFHRRSRASRLDRTATCVGLTRRKPFAGGPCNLP
jgi:hypothetical protein